MLVGLELRSDQDCFLSVYVEFEGRVKSSSQGLSEQGGHSFAVCLGEWKDLAGHLC